MRLNLIVTLLDYKRIPAYFFSVVFALRENILVLRKKIYGMLTIPECVSLYKIAKNLPRGSTALEIGTYGGLSSAYILSGLKFNGSYLYSIDPFSSEMNKQKKLVSKYKNLDYRYAEYSSLDRKPSKNDVQNTLKKLGFNNFKLIEGYSNVVVRKWNKKLEFLFIDGNHEYKSVSEDYKTWSKYLVKGGIILFHDANNINYESNWKWGLDGPTRVVGINIFPPKWINIKRIDSLLYAEKNF